MSESTNEKCPKLKLESRINAVINEADFTDALNLEGLYLMDFQIEWSKFDSFESLPPVFKAAILSGELSLLQKQNAELREALKPFAALAPYWDDFSDECPFYRGDYDGETFRLTAGDLRRASTVLSQNPEPQSGGKEK